MGAVKTRRIKDDVIMNMRLIRMSRYNKSMIAFGKSHGGFMAYLIRFLRCNFSQLKGLPDLISDDIALGCLPVRRSYSLFESMNSSSTLSA